MTAPAAPTPSLWTPFGARAFRMLWLALLAQHIAEWFLDTTNGWVMTTLTTSPVLIALVQTASLLPVLAFALPSGALADTQSRRSILLVVEGALALSNAVLAGLAYFDLLSAPLLLTFVFVNGIGITLGDPAWQTASIEVVPTEQRSLAIVLTGLAVNIARGIGPLCAGVILAVATGPAWSFAFSSVGFFVAFLLVWGWQGTTSTAARLSGELVLQAIVTGARFARNEPAIRTALLRVFLFVLVATAYWAVTPLVGRQLIGLDAFAYGLWMATFGVGAVAGGYLMSLISTTIGLNKIVAFATFSLAAGIAAVGLYPNVYVAFPVMFAVGVAWMMAISAFVLSVQTNVPSWVRSRTIAIYFMVFQGTLGLAAVIWGIIAERLGVSADLLIGAAGLLLTLPAGLWWKLSMGESAALAPYGQFPVLTWSSAMNAGRTRALVMFEYTIDEADRPRFVELMAAVGIVRQRNGVTEWGVYQDIAEPRRWIEEFIVDSLNEMEEIRQRTTISDFAALQQAYALHKGDAPTPTIRRLIAPPVPA